MRSCEYACAHGLLAMAARAQLQQRRLRGRKSKSSSTQDLKKSASKTPEVEPEKSRGDPVSTVTYHYVQSPVTCSTRSLSELSSVLPSEGPSLNLLGKFPSPLNQSSLNITPTNSPDHRKRRTRLKTDPDIQRNEVQRLFTIASEQCGSRCSKTANEKTSGNHSHLLSAEMKRVESEGIEDDETFWSQAAEIMECEGWDQIDDGVEDGDSAFVDELLSSGLLKTPQISVTTATLNLSPSPHSNSQSRTATTPLSHKSHVSPRKLNNQPLL